MKLELHWQILIGMLLGALIGVTVNMSLSARKTELTSDLPAGVDSASVSDSISMIGSSPNVSCDSPQAKSVAFNIFWIGHN